MKRQNSVNIQQSICSAIDEMIQKSLTEISFDKTISAIVVDCVDEKIGKYKVKYQDSIFYASCDNPFIIYNNNIEVYVLIPNGDFSKNKKIIGAVNPIGIEYKIKKME